MWTTHVPVPANTFGTIQNLHPLGIGPFIFRIKLLNEMQIPISEFLFTAMPIRQPAPEKLETPHEAKLPIVGGHVPSDPLAEQHKLGTVHMPIGQPVAIRLIDTVP